MSDKIPQIYAGSKFLEELVKTMDMTRLAMAEYRHTDWIDLLNQFYSWVCGYVSNGELEAELAQLGQRAFNLQKMFQSNKQFAQMSSQKILDLRRDIFRVERKLYPLASEILLRMSEREDDDEVDWDDILSKT